MERERRQGARTRSAKEVYWYRLPVPSTKYWYGTVPGTPGLVFLYYYKKKLTRLHDISFSFNGFS